MNTTHTPAPVSVDGTEEQALRDAYRNAGAALADLLDRQAADLIRRAYPTAARAHFDIVHPGSWEAPARLALVTDADDTVLWASPREFTNNPIAQAFNPATNRLWAPALDTVEAHLSEAFGLDGIGTLRYDDSGANEELFRNRGTSDPLPAVIDLEYAVRRAPAAE